MDSARKWLVRPCLQTGQPSGTCVSMPVITGIRGVTGWVGVVLNAADARTLACFYRDLFGWSLAADEPDWCTMPIPEARANLAFQTEALYEPPTWPAMIWRQQMMMHLDIGVTDLEAAVL